MAIRKKIATAAMSFMFLMPAFEAAAEQVDEASTRPYSRQDKWCGDPTYDFLPDTHRWSSRDYQGYFESRYVGRIGEPDRFRFSKSSLMKHYLLKEGDRVFVNGNVETDFKTGKEYYQVRVDCTLLPLYVWIAVDDDPLTTEEN